MSRQTIKEACQCGDKVKHPSRRVAVENMRRMARGREFNGRRDRVPLAVYLCGVCGSWHCGTCFTIKLGLEHKG